MSTFAPITPDALAAFVADRAAALAGRAVLAVDGADAADPLAFARTVTDLLRTRGRPAEVISLHDYVRPASLRLEYGRDETSYRTAWFDYAGLNREVLHALREHDRWLPALWDERSDRSARATTISAATDTVLFVAGPMLLGRGLDFDLTIALQLSRGALWRSTPEDETFTVAAVLEHRRESDEEPDVLVNWDHPDRPAVRR